jgi:hypothetical protein
MPFDSIPDAQVTARDRLIRLRDHVAKLRPGQFNMNWWNIQGSQLYPDNDPRHDCGTVACLGGWCDLLFLGAYQGENVPRTGALLGLSRHDSLGLFYPSDLRGSYTDITPTQAVRVLDHLLATSSPGTCDGEVDWSRMGEP